MTKESKLEGERIPEDRSVIVISDLHLALDTCEQHDREFHDSPPADLPKFLAFIKLLVQSGGIELSISGRQKKLLPPTKIILLGDIIDLWSPRNNSRGSVISDSFYLIQFLLDLDSEVVYVAGNHDDEIADYKGSFPINPRGKLTIINRRWPSSKDKHDRYTGIHIGTH
ncbi:MAG TPA: metallophosphoesterase, partial [Methanoregulaceae archaeon]|nr:metallophosphoesterase [Methanoregulaceae archaeon]